jgi:hypothetical protein
MEAIPEVFFSKKYFSQFEGKEISQQDLLQLFKSSHSAILDSAFSKFPGNNKIDVNSITLTPVHVDVNIVENDFLFHNHVSYRLFW